MTDGQVEAAGPGGAQGASGPALQVPGCLSGAGPGAGGRSLLHCGHTPPSLYSPSPSPTSYNATRTATNERDFVKELQSKHYTCDFVKGL